jgi:Kelch motif
MERIWSWDGASWELVAADGPPGHVLSGVAWDAGRGALVRYGGIPLAAQECSHETWEWDGTAWRQVDAEGPPACDHLRLAFDEARDQTILVGGGDEDQQLIPGTWAWNGATWSRLTRDGPPPRAHFGLVYDAGHEQAFLYGGYDGAAVFDDFWSWDGATWTELGFEGPGPRSHFGMAVSPDGLLLFGGARSTSTFGSLVGETWYLTDGSWRQVQGPGPAPRGLATLGYDPVRQITVLYGGFDADGAALDDLWEWDGTWSCIAGCP